jgi:hypothetical protein
LQTSPTFSKVARLFNHTGYTQYVLKKPGMFHQLKVFFVMIVSFLLICEDILLYKEQLSSSFFRQIWFGNDYTSSARLNPSNLKTLSLSKDCGENFLLYIKVKR